MTARKKENVKPESAQAVNKKRPSPDTADDSEASSKLVKAASSKLVQAASTIGEAFDAADAIVAVPASVDEAGPNRQYLSNVMKDIAIITEKWPEICKLAPLPLTGTDGHQKLTGYGAPFEVAAYDVQYMADKFEYSCFMNFMMQDMLASVLGDVPLYWERVLDYVADQVTEPGLFRHVSILLATQVKGDDVLKGGLLRLSPCEPSHGIIHAVAKAIADHTPEPVLIQWLRALLSAPCVLKKKKTRDEQFAEANSLRNDADSVAKTVVFSARQMIHTIGNFKDDKEADLKKPFGAKLIASFWRENVKMSVATVRCNPLQQWTHA